MTEYHVGCGIFGIYAGTLNKKGDMWRNKSEVTNEALSAVAQYLLTNEKEFHFDFGDTRYVLAVVESEEKDESI